MWFLSGLAPVFMECIMFRRFLKVVCCALAAVAIISVSTELVVALEVVTLAIMCLDFVYSSQAQPKDRVLGVV